MAIQMRLLAAGQRPISNVVDVSNYVMLELGKPIHTFDAAAIHAGPDGRIVVRLARPGERMETLDHVERELDVRTPCSSRTPPACSLSPASWAARRRRCSDATTDVVHRVGGIRPGQHPADGLPLALRSEASSRFEKGQETALRPPRRRSDGPARRPVGRRRGRRPAPSTPLPGRPARGRVSPSGPARVDRLLGTDHAAEQRDLLERVGIETEPAPARRSRSRWRPSRSRSS